MSADQVVYLEKFVDSTIALPCELTRLLTMMRELDRKSVEMQQNVESMVGTIMQIQAQAATGPAKGSAKGDLASTVDSLLAALHENQSLLIQWAEEKVQLALLGYELLKSHQKNLDLDVHNLTQFLSDTGQLEEYIQDDYNGVHADAHMYESSDPPGSLARSGRRGGSTSRGAGYTTSADVYEEEPVASKQIQQQQSQKISLRTNIPLNLNRQQQPSSQQVFDEGESGKNTGTKRRRAAALANTAAPPQEVSRSGRRTAAGQATAAVMAAQYDDEEYAADQKAAAAAAAQQQAAAAAAAQQQAAALAQDPALLAQPIALEPFIPGLAECAKEPQAARRRLEEKDIGLGLLGKVAEVYWEDESDSSASMWYLVKVESVDLANKTACVRYQNGEVETNLSLLEAARDGIMLLV